MHLPQFSDTQIFQSTRPMRGATLHLPQFSDTQIFQSTRPMRGATLEQLLPPSWQKFQSTRPMRGATRVIERGKFVGAISIHTPHAGRDGVLGARADKSPDFNPHAPCGARPTQQYYGQYELGFQSTRPMRGATRIDVADVAGARHFNPHAPCGARLEYKQGRPRKPQISIHTPHAGRDVPHVGKSGNVLISIHTPHAGRDLHVHNTTIYRELFQSTRPMRGATYTTRAVR